LSSSAFRGISLSILPGEIVGLAGLVGAGRSELARCIAGVDRWTDGAVLVAGRSLGGRGVGESQSRGVVLVPEDRRVEGLILPMAIATNLSLGVLRSLCRAGFVSRGRETHLVHRFVRELSVKSSNVDAPAATLSG